jgi:hypothetical protein
MNLKNSDMKTIRISLVIFLALFFASGCLNEEHLDLLPLGDTEADIFDEAKDFDQALYGTYSKIADFYIYGSNAPIHEFFLLPGDDLTSVGSYDFEIFSTMQPGTEMINRYFDYAYHLVSRANTVLEKIAADEELGAESAFEGNTGLRDNYKGEALFLRGWMFFHLWVYYGTAPVITERISTSDKINPESSDGIQLLDQAITDFTDAVSLLPSSWPDVSKGRADKSAANGYLGKAYCHKASWTQDNSLFNQALTAFNAISDKSLMADFRDNFSVYTENNDESLFENQAGEASASDNVWLMNDDFSVVGSHSAYYGYFNNDWSFWAQTPFIATDKLVATMDPADPRAAETFDPATKRIQKYLLENTLAGTGVGSINNTRLLRYADVLLLMAEAQNETGNSNSAIALINQVRTRARNMVAGGTVPANRATGASQAQVRTWIMEERLLELAAEGQRWMDLRRWHKAGHIDLSTFDFSSDNGSFNITMPKHLLYPLPSNEVDLNKNITQNDGY